MQDFCKYLPLTWGEVAAQTSFAAVLQGEGGVVSDCSCRQEGCNACWELVAAGLVSCVAMLLCVLAAEKTLAAALSVW